jgi:4-hydroxyproline epimerase
MPSRNNVETIRVIDSHTGGEPTRVVVSGGPNLGTGSMAERRELCREKYDGYRSAIVNEPRGSDVLVGAYLCEPTDPSCVAGVIFFNNVGYLGMCGHGTMGVAVTLAQLGRIGPGKHKLETPVGVVSFEFDGGHKIALDNVPSFRYAADIKVEVEAHDTFIGDVAWGGNWFFLVTDSGLWFHLDNGVIRASAADTLAFVCESVRRGLAQQGITGAAGAEIDHIELFGPPQSPENHSRNFVLCPGGAYDRSPCGTGTSAKLACLYTAGKLREGEIYRQESIIGSVFEGSVRIVDGKIIPRIVGSAFVTGEATLILDPNDPFRMGIRP